MNETLRSRFPALLHPMVFLDGPAGTQVPGSVIEAISRYYQASNANTHGHFTTSQATDEVIDQARKHCATFLKAESPECISFGANMTSIAFKLSRAFSRMFALGDEVVITQLDHEANRGPWLTLEENGVVVREIALLPDGTLDYDDAAKKINEKTRLVAAGLASNILGTVNDIARLRALASRVGAWILVDAVHYAPHYPIDVQTLDCDFLLCSAYKFYGPHVGILYCKPGLLNTLPTDRLRTAPQAAPGRIENGTFNHAALAGTSASIDFLASIGEGAGLRERLITGFRRLGQHERQLAVHLREGLESIPGVTVYGTSFGLFERTPTLAFSLQGADPKTICKYLGERGIAAWDGHFYAIRTIEVLGLEKIGGVVRLGIAVYNTEEEIDFTIKTLSQFNKNMS